MRPAIVTALLSLICSAFGQDVEGDGEKDGKELAQQMVAKLRGISPTDWFGFVEKAYAKRQYPADDLQKFNYQRAFERSYQTNYTEMGSKVAGPRPEQTTSGENEDVNEAIKRQLQITPEDDYEFTLALKFNLATKQGKPVWKCDSYQFKAKGKYHVGAVVVEQGKITYTKSF